MQHAGRLYLRMEFEPHSRCAAFPAQDRYGGNRPREVEVPRSGSDTLSQYNSPANIAGMAQQNLLFIDSFSQYLPGWRSHPDDRRVRNILFNLRLNSSCGSRYFVEVQFHVEPILKLNESMGAHACYEYFRTVFAAKCQKHCGSFRNTEYPHAFPRSS